MTQKRLTAYFYLLLASIIWGIAGPVIKFTLDYFPPSIFLTYRFAISTIVGLMLMGKEKPKLPRTINLLFLLLVACVFTATLRLGLLFLGFDETSSLSGSLISAMGPVMLVLTGHFFFKEKVTRIEQVGMTIALIGTLISVAEPVLRTKGALFDESLRGNLLIFISLIADVIAILLAKYLFSKKVSESLLTHLSFIVGFVTIMPIALYQYDWVNIVNTIMQAPLEGHIGVWYMALISGTLAYLVFNKGVKRIEVGEASLFTYLTPIWAAPLALFWLGEQITIPFIVSAFIIFLGVAIAELYRRAR